MVPPRDVGDWLALTLIGVVAASVIVGFVLIGGPGTARAEQQDAARMSAVADLAEALACYRDGIGPLPAGLAGVREAIETPTSAVRLAENCSHAKWAVDPVTGADFEVVAITAETAGICAVFARPRQDARNDFQYRYAGRDVLVDADAPRLQAGRFCYTAKLTRAND